jgi:single-strand DNA-binding protein
MNLIGNVRLGRDVELKHTASGTAVANLAGVYEYGRKGDDGKKPSQWVDLALFGKQAEALAQYLLKGAVLHVVVDEVHVETYQSAKGAGAKLVGKVNGISFAPSQPAKEAAPKPRQTAPVDDFDDGSDLPF